MSETFLSRWSRRKQEVRTSEPAPEGAVPAGDAASEPEAQTAVADGRGEEPTAPAELSADEIAALPSLEDLTPETDISVFLRKGVPESLRNAALRRMWVLDPKIRDFVCEAREYAYDWNTPGGVPGSGPLPTTEEVLRMAARIVGGGADEAAQPTGDRAKDVVQDREQPSSRTEASHIVADAPQPVDGAADFTKTPPPSLSTEFGEAGAAATRGRADEPPGPLSRRRHGGAIPL